MKRNLLFYFLTFSLLSLPVLVEAQCTPGDETSCPDPENNGQFCPEVLPDAIALEDYSEDFTVLAPPEYVLDSAAGVSIELHHITLVNVTNLPAGLTWQTNSEDSVFNVGTYYCVLLEGVADEIGFYPLHITVDVYIPGIFGSPPIYVATVTDSTTLSLLVKETSGIGDNKSGIHKLTCSPNPFTDEVEFNFYHPGKDQVTLEIHDLVGNTVYREEFQAYDGLNRLSYDGRNLEPGVYLASFKDKSQIQTSRIIKSR